MGVQSELDITNSGSLKKFAMLKFNLFDITIFIYVHKDKILKNRLS